MDGDRFDRLTTFVVGLGPRRALLRVLAALPLTGALAAVGGQASAAGRRKRRKARHDPGKDRDKRQRRRKHKNAGTGKDKKRTPGCIPEPVAQTCPGKCAMVTNTCGTPVDCGPCACTPACPACQTCNASTGQCVNRPDGTACGTGLECLSGTCTCTSSSCPDGCCAGSTCQTGEADTVCGKQGAACVDCTAVGRSCTGNGVCARGCPGLGACSGSNCDCATNLSGGPAFVCATDPAACSTNECADCAADGRVCTVATCDCPNCQVCGTPC